MHLSQRGERVRDVVVVLAALAVVVALVVAVVRRDPAVKASCETTVSGSSVRLSPEQMGNAATVAGISVKRGLPARAATIGLATVMQESTLVNVSYGDRDSLGLFQQRPSQGWGTKAQVMDPVHATNAFYDVLVDVDDYRTRPVTEVAQAVQRSGFPDAYAQHEGRARVLASALTGQSPAALACRLDPDERPSGEQGLPPLVRALRAELPAVASTRVRGRDGLRLRTRSPATTWAVAQWAVAQAERLGVARVYADGRLWSRTADSTGWTSASGPGVPGRGAGATVILLEDRAPA